MNIPAATGPKFVRLCAVEELPSGKQKAFVVEGHPILLLNLMGQFHAVRDRCTHLDFPLEGGRQMGYELICRRHGARFDIRTGRPLGGPAVRPLAVYEVRIHDGAVEVALGYPL